MSIILLNIMTLVPSLPSENEVELSDGGKINYDSTNFFKIPLGGDQLMVAELNAFFVVVLTRQWNIYRVLPSTRGLSCRDILYEGNNIIITTYLCAISMH